MTAGLDVRRHPDSGRPTGHPAAQRRLGAAPDSDDAEADPRHSVRNKHRGSMSSSIITKREYVDHRHREMQYMYSSALPLAPDGQPPPLRAARLGHGGRAGEGAVRGGGALEVFVRLRERGARGRGAGAEDACGGLRPVLLEGGEGVRERGPHDAALQRVLLDERLGEAVVQQRAAALHLRGGVGAEHEACVLEALAPHRLLAPVPRALHDDGQQPRGGQGGEQG
eukprot:CAMPEP_0206038382 /NCGR_PEP_ID=MMETSP1466-20131121/4076_1 /ASSEMBLY_ACC=CAM_ASM_001126 /TAXON_ID=44452 /ORGANISM="Pavlova gyrans, Strain CCMP608" /LENGTH=224 /DNA_ID=CAMNT_0053412979 /DNA_START=257 /DNA_END=929 /DNA_ORIENTATION=+